MEKRVLYLSLSDLPAHEADAPAITVLCPLHLPGLLNPRLPRGTMLFRSCYAGHSDVPKASETSDEAAASDWSHLHGIERIGKASCPWGGGDSAVRAGAAGRGR